MSEPHGRGWAPWGWFVGGVAIGAFGRLLLDLIIESEPVLSFAIPLVLCVPIACFIVGFGTALLRASGKLSIPALMNLVGIVISVYFLFAPLFLR